MTGAAAALLLLQQTERERKAREEASRARFSNNMSGAVAALGQVVGSTLRSTSADPRVWREVAATMVSAKDYDRAAEVLKCLHEAQPTNPEPCYQLAALYDTMGQYDVALRWISAAFRRLTSSYGKVVCCTMYGELCYKMGDAEKGARMWDLALSVPDSECNGPAMFAKSEILLARGEWAQGWRLFEARWHTEEAWRIQRLHQTDRASLAPEWDGKAGGHVHLCAEQGTGDVLQMLRYIPHGPAITLQCQAELVPFVRRYCNFANMVVVPNGERVTADYSCPIMSLPHKLGMGPIPPVADRLATRERSYGCECDDCKDSGAFGPEPLRVGVCWRGSKDHGNDRDRSSPIDFREAFNGIEGVEVVSLQHGEPTRFRDFAATAEVIESCDVVVTVDTSVLHLAGTLGVPTVCIPPTRPELRFPLTHETETPWYPSVTVVRRTRSDAWDEAITEAKAHVARML